MQRRLGTGVLFITHDFGVVADIADRVIVMQEGLIVESGTSTQVLNKPKHKDTQSLIASIPRLKPRKTSKRSKEVVVETSALHKSFGGGRSFLGFGRRTRTVDAVIDVNIELRKGETHWVLWVRAGRASQLWRAVLSD